MIADVDCTTDEGKPLCEKYGVQGYPTIKYWTKESGDDGEKYEGARDYNALKKFVNRNKKDPCNPFTLENCGKKAKEYLETIKDWDADKKKTEQDDLSKQITDAKAKQKELEDRFEKEKDIAIATQKEADAAKTAVESLSKKVNYKVKILEALAAGPPEQKAEL